MADQATYFLMAAYMSVFAALFIGVIGAIALIVRDQEASERPATRAIDERPPVRISVGTADGAARGAPAASRNTPASTTPAM